MAYSCAKCTALGTVTYVELAEQVCGPRWWAPPSIPEAQADAIHRLMRRGVCEMHARLIADILGLTIRTEAARRAALPGTVEVRHVAIEREPYEEITAGAARRHAEPVVAEVRKFVAGSALSALVEVDIGNRRARVTFQLVVDDATSPPSTVIDSPRLVHLTAQELVAALRDRRSADGPR